MASAGPAPFYDRRAFETRPEPVGVLDRATGAVGVVERRLGPYALVQWTDGRRVWRHIHRWEGLLLITGQGSVCVGDAPVPFGTPAWTLTVAWENGYLKDTRQYRWRPVQCARCGDTTLRRCIESAWGWDVVVDDDAPRGRVGVFRCCGTESESDHIAGRLEG